MKIMKRNTRKPAFQEGVLEMAKKSIVSKPKKRLAAT
jgi:hypothetical protein